MLAVFFGHERASGADIGQRRGKGKHTVLALTGVVWNCKLRLSFRDVGVKTPVEPLATHPVSTTL